MNLIFASDEIDLSKPIKEDSTLTDLDFDPILDSMADGNRNIREICKMIFENINTDRSTVELRQTIVMDAMSNLEKFQQMAKIASDTVKVIKEHIFWMHSGKPSIEIFESRMILSTFLDALPKIMQLLGSIRNGKCSEIFKKYVDEFINTFNEKWLNGAREIISVSDFSNFLAASVSLDWDLSFRDISLFKSGKKRLIGFGTKTRKWTLPQTCESCGEELESFRDAITGEVASILRIIVSFVHRKMLQMSREFSFYVGCVNFINRMNNLGISLTFPNIIDGKLPEIEFTDLVEASLALRSGKRPVPNSLERPGAITFIVTGPNSGGKTVFLRSVGQAQILAQSGLPVPATMYRSTIFNHVFAYFSKYEKFEDQKGRFEKELLDLQEIVSNLTCKDLVILDEPLASTNQYDGAMIMKEVIRSFENGLIVTLISTHFYHLVLWTRESKNYRRVLMTAERLSDGQRTFKIKQAPDAQGSSWAADVWERIIADDRVN